MIIQILRWAACVLLLPSFSPAQVDATAVLRAERLAAGADGWKGVGALVIDGSVTEGAVAMKLHRVIDLATGRSRTTRQAGRYMMFSGFDTVAWNAFSGIVNSIDLPALVEDARARAFIDRAGWRSRDAIARVVHSEDHPDHNEATIVIHPARTSQVALTFDKRTHLLKRAEVEADYGPVVMTFSDWKSVGALKYPFQQSEVDSTGETTVVQVETLRPLPRANRNEFARPSPQALAHLANGRPSTVAIGFTGARQSHILVPAIVDNTETQLLFDTGAANYFSPAAAKRMGLDLFGGVNISGVGESSSAGGYAYVDHMTIGNAELRDQVALVGPLPFPSTPGPNGRVTEGSAGFEYAPCGKRKPDFAFQIVIPARGLLFGTSINDGFVFDTVFADRISLRVLHRVVPRTWRTEVRPTCSFLAICAAVKLWRICCAVRSPTAFSSSPFSNLSRRASIEEIPSFL